MEDGFEEGDDFDDKNPPLTGKFDTTSGLGNKELDKPKRDVATPFEFSNQFYNEDNQLEDDQERTMDNSTPISTSQPAKTMAVPKQVPESRNERLRKYLNKGGSGDVLTGIITGLIAQNYDPLTSAIFGVYLHGRAADIAINHTAYEGLTASMITEFLGQAYLDLFAKPEKEQ